MASRDALYASPDLDEEPAHPPVESMYEGPAGEMHGERVRAESASAGGGPDTLPPGARRYCEEQGLP
ncbi:hypothetical protein [Nocardiopsis sp. CC223A]|uniref:hypothetical protein n=1 Tax=Nocardiopsis sp. CC223A TaxID=3044051 RepID=UPI0027959058|nr:hypothetical protein [Nocardiopsis sp. CC223A]